MGDEISVDKSYSDQFSEWKNKYIDKLKLNSRYIISYKNPRKEQWDLFVLILAIQNSIMIPVDMAFNPGFTDSLPYKIFDNVVDAIFLIDIILMFMTSYMNKQGAESFDSRDIAVKYVKSIRFVTDFFAILGTDVFTHINSSFQIFGLFKMIRVFRMGGMIAKLNIPEDNKASLNILKLFFYLFLFLHATACGLFI